MKNGLKIAVMGSCILVLFLLFTAVEAKAAIFYGKVVGMEGSVFQVKSSSSGNVFTFWVGHKTYIHPRAPLVGDRVKITYVRDKLKRRAVTKLIVLGR
jgi:hypothetical protein